jgi:hypothetical protein
VLSVDAGASSVEAGNVRHEHEWRVWKEAKLPDGKLLLHLSYSYAPPCGPALLVTQCHLRTLHPGSARAAAPS